MTLRNFDVRRNFDRAADHFDDYDFVHAVTRAGLMSRLEPMLVEAETVVDLGCATGTACKPLARKFRGAHIIAIDQSANMLCKAGGKRSWFSKFSLLQASANAIPLADQSVDVVFCNQLLPWVTNSGEVFSEVGRVLRKNGLFLFASLGPDSFSELRRAWQDVDAGPHVHPFPDMHDLGDAAVRAGMRDPVLDVDRLGITYKDAEALFRDLSGCGARNCLADRALALTGKDRFNSMVTAIQRGGNDSLIKLDLELVYGHCWGSGPRARDGEVRISAEGIGRRS
ncbi:MAG: class I SAM-dependent methyltransferase [Woeseiaceae bacterium]